MKKLTFVGTLLFFITQLYAQIEYEIAPWYNQKKASVVLTFDDWSPDHPSFVVPELLKRDFTGTFYVNQLPSYKSVVSAANKGIEIGNHTKSHPDLTTKDELDIQFEIEGFNKSLNKELQGYQTATFAYPFGTGVGETEKEIKIRALLQKHFVAARGVQSIQNPNDVALTYDFAKTEDDYFKLKVAPVSDGIENFMERIAWIEQKGGMLVHMYHGTLPGLYDVVPQKEFSRQLDSLQAHTDLWVTSLENAVKYHRECKKAKITEITAPFSQQNTWQLALTDDLPDDIYQQALTVKLELPAKATSITKIEQNNKQLNFWWDGKKVVFNAIPDAGNITVYLLDCDAPQVNLQATSSTSICFGEEVTMKTTFNQAYDYQWLKNGKPLQGEKKPTGVFTTPGIYEVEVSKGNCKLISHQAITIDTTGICGIPKACFKASKYDIYTNQELVLKNYSSNLSGNETYSWVLPNDAKVIEGKVTGNQKEDLKVVFSKEGSKVVSLTVKGEKGTNTLKLKPIQVIQPTQYVYKEDFGGPLETLSIGGWNDYKYSKGKGALKVEYLHATSNEWYTWEHEFKAGAGKRMLDFSNPQNTPVIKIRMRASDTVTIGVFLVDKYNLMTAGQMHNTKALLDVTTEYKEYTIDFRDLFLNQWQNLLLDSAHVPKIRIGANFGYSSFPFTNTFGKKIDKAFVGILEVDFLAIGQNAEFPNLLSLPKEACVGEKILVDYYFNGEEKVEWILSKEIKREGNFIWSEQPIKGKIQLNAGKEKLKGSLKFKTCPLNN